MSLRRMTRPNFGCYGKGHCMWMNCGYCSVYYWLTSYGFRVKGHCIARPIANDWAENQPLLHFHGFRVRKHFRYERLRRNCVLRERQIPNRFLFQDDDLRWPVHFLLDALGEAVQPVPNHDASRVPIRDASLNGNGPNPSPTLTNYTNRGDNKVRTIRTRGRTRDRTIRSRYPT